MNDNLRRWLPWIAVAAMALILALVVNANLGGDDVAAIETTTTTLGSATTDPGSTTSAPVTTTTTEPTTTTTAVPETTTTTVAETTTTVGTGTVELTRVGVQAGEAWVPFAEDDEVAISAVATVLGAPTHDSGWVESFSSPYGVCPAPLVRGVHWDDFVMLFTQADTDFWTAGVPHFYAYTYTGTTPELFTTEGIGIGSTLEMLDAVYGGTDLVIEEAWFDPSLGFWSYKLATWTGLSGFATGRAVADTITSINGGQGCGE